MNGDLTLRSGDGAGSSFDLTLPLYPVLFREKQSAGITSSFSMSGEISSLPERETDRPLVCIAEDDGLRQYLHRIIGMRFRVVTASIAARVLHLFRGPDRKPVSLTPRETQLLEEIIGGYSAVEIARTPGTAGGTVRQ